VERVQELVCSGAEVVLVSQGLEARDEAAGAASGSETAGGEPPGIRDGVATGRLLEPVIRRGERLRGYRAEPGWAACAEDAGAAVGYRAGAVAGGGDWSRSGNRRRGNIRLCISKDGSKRRDFRVRRALGRQTGNADRRYRILSVRSGWRTR